jgi:glycine/D-amino acid oxidase-like deaminating enzyme
VRQHYSTEVATRLTLAGVGMLSRMPEELGTRDVFVQCGWRMLVPEPLMDAARRNVEMQRTLGVETELLAGAAAAADLPWLNPEGVAGICHEPKGGYADPVRATEAYVDAFERNGGTFRARTPVRRLLGTRERITGVLTEDGPLHAGIVVNAAGPWARPLAEGVGLALPLRALREQDTVCQARPGRPLPDTSISNAVDATYLRPLGDGRFVCGRGFPKDYEDVDPYNYKQSPDESFVADTASRIEHRYPPLAGATRIDAYTALYDVTPDWYPFVGPRGGVEGYCDACGGSGHGFKLGPAIGLELARWIVRGQVAEDFRQLSFDRIGAGRPFAGAYGGNRG